MSFTNFKGIQGFYTKFQAISRVQGAKIYSRLFSGFKELWEPWYILTIISDIHYNFILNCTSCLSSKITQVGVTHLPYLCLLCCWIFSNLPNCLFWKNSSIYPYIKCIKNIGYGPVSVSSFSFTRNHNFYPHTQREWEN